MSGARAAARLLACLAIAGALAPAAIGSRLLALLRREAPALFLARGVLRLWAGATAAVLGVRVRVRGRVPRGAFVVVSNHLSYLDVLVLGRLLAGRFVAKSEIAGWPLLGWMSRSVGTIFIDQVRRRDLVRVGAEVRATLARGTSVVLFAEGRASSGADVEPFKSSLLEPAARDGIPCLPVTLSYRAQGARWGEAFSVAWWGGMKFWPHFLRLAALRRVDACVSIAPEPVVGHDRKELARLLRRAVADRFDPLPQEPAPPELVAVGFGRPGG